MTNNSSNIIRVAIYNRCSTEEEAQINALQIQAEESLEHAKRLGWTVVDQYIESKSGTSTHNRTEYQRLIDDMSENKFDIIMIKSIDRLNRNTLEWYLFTDRLAKYQLKLYMYIDNQYYTDDDKLISGIKAMLAEDYSRELSKKIKNAHSRRQNKKSGFNITKEIYGWDKVGKNEFIINEEEANIVREIYMMSQEGMGRRNIARTLEKRGVLRKDGKPLSEMNIRGILTSPKYYGTVVLHTDETNFNLKKRVKVPESEWIYIEDALPAIINKELFDKVNKVTKESSIKCSVDYSSRDMSKVGKHKLSGKLICGCCGSVYYRYQPKNRNGIKLKQWKCSKAIMNGKTTSIGCNNRNLYEHNIYNAIEEACKKHYNFIYTSNDNIIDELLNTIKQVISNDTSQVELNSLNKELSKQKGRKNILFDKLMNQVISDSDFKMYNDKISENISDIENRISKIESKSINIKEYEERLTKIRESLNDDSIISEAKTSELIDRIDKIIVYDKIIQIIFNKDKMGELVSIYDSLNEHELDEKYYIINIECSSLTENDLKLQNKRNETNKRILEYFRNNPKLTLKELYKLLDCKESYINTSVWQLEKQGKLKKIRHGIPASEWLVIDN